MRALGPILGEPGVPRAATGVEMSKVKEMAAEISKKKWCGSGRPPKELAGEVEERILEAARKVFLERGFEGASIDEIAETARAGKPTIYSRYQNKQALFAAALTGHLDAKHERVRSSNSRGGHHRGAS